MKFSPERVLCAWRERVQAGASPTVLVGTDSHLRPGVHGRHHRFVTAVGLHQNTMEHRFMLLWRRVESVPSHHLHSIPHRMIEETLRTLALAQELAEEIPHNAFSLGLDINPDPAYPSQAALQSCVSMCRAAGFQRVTWKPDALITYAADRWAK